MELRHKLDGLKIVNKVNKDLGKMGRILSFIWIAFLSEIVYATPVGMNPTQGYCQTVDGSACGWGGGGSRQPTRVINIPSRYGAIVYDGSKGIVGAVDNNLRSLRSAKNEAVKRCIGYGGSKASCKVVVDTRNGCVALALGDHKEGGGVHYGTSRKTLQQAEDDAMQGCRDMGGEKCFLAYSKCSRDPRYQVGR